MREVRRSYTFFETEFFVLGGPVAFFLLKTPSHVGLILDPPGGFVFGPFNTK